jgi:glycosyltransferase involved in cell wall biosynthesis
LWIEAWNIERPALQQALHHADRILSISSYTRDRLLKEQNLDPAKVFILPCTFDPTRFEIAPKPAYLLERYNLKPEQPIILTVSRLAEAERYKGYDQILKALPQIRQTIPDVHYLIVGKGNDRPRIEQLIAHRDCRLRHASWICT